LKEIQSDGVNPKEALTSTPRKCDYRKGEWTAAAADLTRGGTGIRKSKTSNIFAAMPIRPGGEF